MGSIKIQPHERLWDLVVTLWKCNKKSQRTSSFWGCRAWKGRGRERDGEQVEWAEHTSWGKNKSAA